MELFLEFVCTIALSLLLSFILAKILPFSCTKENDFVSELKSIDENCERAKGFVEKDVVINGEEESNDFEVEGFVSESRGLLQNVNKMSENFTEENCKEMLLDQNPERSELEEIEIEFVNNEEVEDVNKMLLSDEEDDDWEGVERTELERVFGVAVAFVGSKMNDVKASNLGSDLKVQLYGLHKVATVGPCLEPQPMALKISARSKWNAWHRLGNMDPESAMEQYITLLSRSIPGWMKDGIDGDTGRRIGDAESSKKIVCGLENLVEKQQGAAEVSCSSFP